MKYLVALLILISCKCCFGQGARFQFYLTKACTNVEQLDTTYYITTVNISDTAYYPKKGTVYLPKPGRYKIGFMEGPLIDTPIVEIRDTGLFTFRYKEPRIQIYSSSAFDSPPYYVRCDSAINGYAEDFYPNGNLKIRGNFYHGYRKDSLVTFYITGITNRRVKALHKTITIEEYDQLGNLVRLRRSQNKSFMEYRDSWEKEFYPNGKLKTEKSSIKRMEKVKEFYPSGQVKVNQTKTGRVEYYETGVKNIVYTLKRKKSDFTWHSGNYTITKNEFDENGKLLQTSVFEYWSDSARQPEFDISRSDWIVSITKYKNGMHESVVDGMDTKDYLKKLEE